MASTGKGKTIANARIMTGLSEKNKCRNTPRIIRLRDGRVGIREVNARLRDLI